MFYACDLKYYVPSALKVIVRPHHRPFVLVSWFIFSIYMLSYLKFIINPSLL